MSSNPGETKGVGAATWPRVGPEVLRKLRATDGVVPSAVGDEMPVPHSRPTFLCSGTPGGDVVSDLLELTAPPLVATPSLLSPFTWVDDEQCGGFLLLA